MVEEEIKSSDDNPLNIEGLENRPICPVCQGYLESAPQDYQYRRLNPDTRWFWCPACEGHLGYHRLRKKWSVDPYDLDTSTAFRDFFGLISASE